MSDDQPVGEPPEPVTRAFLRTIAEIDSRVEIPSSRLIELLNAEAENERLRATAQLADQQAQQRIRELEDNYAAVSKRLDEWRALADARAAENDRLRASLRKVMDETGTSTLAHHAARAALDQQEAT